MIQFFIDNKEIIIGALLAVSEVLALIPSLKANGILQGIISFLQKNKA